MSQKSRNNKLPDNLPQLQNLIKRDGASYREEFLQQYRHYQSHLEVFRLKPSKFIRTLNELVTFIAQIAQCYREELATYPQELCDILQTHGTVLDPTMRMTLVKALILLRNKNLIPATSVLELFFKLFRCQDKLLRKTLFNYIISDIKNVNAKHKDAKLNSTLQNFMYTMLRDNNHTAAKMSLDVMIDLYRRNIWNDAKVVNVISTACFSKVTKVLVAAMKFFLGHNEESDEEEDDYDSDNEQKEPTKQIKKAKVNLKIGKKTRKRMRKMDKELKMVKKVRHGKKAPNFNFSALHLLHDPQEFCEKLFQKLQTSNERFEVKLMMMDLISRLIGIHQLILCNFYPFLQKFLQPRQKEVTKLLLFAAQASHALVPPDLMEDVLKTIANNFITERNVTDAMAVGLNATREICARCPLAMGDDLLQDLVQYKSHRVKSVITAARSLLHFFRETDPDKLRRKDRGKPTEAQRELITNQYGEVNALNYIPGAEALSLSKDDDENGNEESDEWEECEDEDDSEGEWIDVHHDAELKASGSESESGDENEEELDEAERIKKAQEILSTRILTQAEFRRIQKRQLAKQLHDRPRGKKRKLDQVSRGELPHLSNIESIDKKHKSDKESKMAAHKAEKESREKQSYHRERSDPFASTTNKEKRKNKNFLMLRPKATQRRNKRSFREKQVLLRDNLLRRAKLRRKKKI
ncbi:hypothetical protein SNE40_001207 [Patella caerulea]|uniref:Protein SDA1 n=1 Tax=Patella caerulea TaxID=87958 RepID=A0AAN8QHU0_PATCE